ncbi:MAG: hypothetical protein JSS81_14045 [Acidobacteria bacterium]|nr:hypothetical protein [Acidobacteriota bacterium]
MKSKWMVAVLTALIFSLSQISFAQDAAKAEWTILFYMDSDNNLEAPQLNDLEEMMAVGTTPNVNLIVLCDRSAKGDDEDGYTDRPVGGLKNWTTAKYMVIEKGRLRELADWGEANMGDPATLRKYLLTATAEFPAKHYGLVFGDHGAGWMGIVHDESAGEDSLTAAELPVVFKDVTATTGKFELIGFDACLMANLEAAKSIAPYGKAMVASEELEPGNGWDYTPILTALAKNPQMDGLALGRTIVDVYKNYYLGPKQGNRKLSVTLGVIDLDKVPALEAATGNLAVAGQSFMKTGAGRQNWMKTSEARSKTEEYGIQGAYHLYYYDLVDYAENIKRRQPDAETVKAADGVIAAVKAAVVYKINGTARPNSNGMSIYFPPDQKKANGDYLTTPFSQTNKWTPFIGEFMGITTGDQQAPELAPVESSDTDIAKQDVVTVTAHVKADDIDEATFVLAESHDDGAIIIGAVPTEPDEKGLLHEEWDGSWFSIGDGKKEMICPITKFEELDEGQDTFYVEVPAQIRYRGTKQWHDVTLYFYLDFNQEEVVGEFVYAFEYKGSRGREVDVEAGDALRPVYVAVDAKGEIELIASDDADDILNVTEDDDITVGRMDVAPGKYLIGFTVTDYAGNSNDEFKEVTIE